MEQHLVPENIKVETTSESQLNSHTPPTFNDLLGAMSQLTRLVNQHVTSSIENQERSSRKFNNLDSFQRKDPPSFTGTPDPDIAENWKLDIEKIFKAMECTDEQRLRFATFKLTGEAEHWWAMTKRQMAKEEAGITWKDFKDAFDRQYFPDSVRKRKEEEFDRLYQGNNSVAEYEVRFNALSRYAPHIADDKRKARKFVKGLRESIRDKLTVFRFQSYQEAVGYALNAEGSELDRDAERRYKRPRFDDEKSTENHKDKKREEWNQGEQRNQQKCQRQQSPYQQQGYQEYQDQRRYREQQGHQGQQSLRPQCQNCGKFHSGICYGKTIICFNCGDKGHLMRDCRRPRKSNLGDSSNNRDEQRKRIPERVYVMTAKDAETSPAEATGNLSMHIY